MPICLESGGQGLEGIQNLLLAVRRGEHALVAPILALEHLARNPALGDRERATAKYLLNRRSELFQLERLVDLKVRVHARNLGPKLSRSGSAWELSAGELAKKFTNKVAILAENMVDADLYSLAGKHYLIQQRVNGVSISTLQRGGGGSQLDVELCASLKAGQPTIAVSDGDKNYPGQLMSDVAYRCSELVESCLGVGWHFSIDCYAAENLLPINLYLEVCKHEGRHEEVGRLIHIDSFGEKPSDYFNLKSGLSLRQIFNFLDESKRQYWLALAAKMNHGSYRFDTCLESSRCMETPCKCVLSEGFGEGALRLIRDWAFERSPHQSHSFLKNSQKWLDLGKLIFEVGLALPQQRI